MKDIDVPQFHISPDTLNLHIPGRKIPDDFKRLAIIISIEIEYIINLHINNILHMIVFFLLFYLFGTIFYV